MRVSKTILVTSVPKLKKQLFLWAQQFDQVVYLDSNAYKEAPQKFEAVLAVKANTSVESSCKNAFSKLRAFKEQTNDWIFGFLTYDLKNDIEDLKSENDDGLNFPDLYFFQPEKLFFIEKNTLTASYLKEAAQEIEKDLNHIQNTVINTESSTSQNIKIKLRIHKDEYIQKVNSLLSHIQRGDIYEANFCQEFYAEGTTINPAETFLKLNEVSKAPFASFLKYNTKYLLSASPERYLKKEGTTVISQPIKGTAKRSKDKKQDAKLKKELTHSEKERSENIMIVDLVRNDLSRIAEKNSVQVTELCKAYTFKQVHQLISTISCQVSSDTAAVDIVKATFPMGSMTGAPKISAMKLIEQIEKTKRGLYSGTLGYFSPDNNFDFSVIIRSILYNSQKKYVSYSVGGAITAKSDAFMEYEECLLKAKAMREVLEG